MIECAICRQPLPADAEFCPDCGTQVQRAMTGATLRLSTSTAPSCPKCGNPMDRGFIPDEYRDRNEVTVWVLGQPERSLETGRVVLTGTRMWHVVTYRCTACGYLESYARDELQST
jgi:hypothetical protein